MLGKRFRRTTSMSQLGPAWNNSLPAPQNTQMQGGQEHTHTDVVCLIAPRKEEGDFLVLRGGNQSNGDALYIARESDRLQETCVDDVAMSSENQSVDEEIKPVNFLRPLVPYQMGLWTGAHQQSMQCGVPDHGGAAELLHHIRAEASIAPIDFLDVCFFCKRRLKRDRDIFMYRGDSAFCSEECRHRQILSDDERRLLREAAAASSKRGARRASSSETAVAA